MRVDKKDNHMTISLSREDALLLINKVSYQLLSPENKYTPDSADFRSYGEASYISFAVEEHDGLYEYGLSGPTGFQGETGIKG